LARQPGENVGVYAINQGSLALSANYALSYQSANVRITVRQITFSAQDSGKAFGTADPVLPYAVTSTTGLVAGDRFTGRCRVRLVKTLACMPLARASLLCRLTTRWSSMQRVLPSTKLAWSWLRRWRCGFVYGQTCAARRLSAKSATCHGESGCQGCFPGAGGRGAAGRDQRLRVAF
jgi:hypothetical protein